MPSKNAILQNFRLYAVTDGRGSGEDLPEKIEQAYRGGADIVQLRAKKMADKDLLLLGQKIRIIADRHHKLFFVNDRVDIALAVRADGVHLGQEDLPVAIARELASKAGHPLLIGKSIHSIEQALQAQSEGADYIGVGPVFPTPTKPGRNPVGLTLVRQVADTVQIPFVAIGGIDAQNIQQVLEAGAERVACVRAIFDQKDITRAAKNLRDKFLPLLTSPEEHGGGIKGKMR